MAPPGRGSRATGASCAWAAARGAEAVEVGVYTFNEAARSFYRNIGFECISSKLRKALPANASDAPRNETERPTLVGRSSSHFTRLARMVALECEVAHDFEVVHDLLSTDAVAYGGHPALRIPSLRREGEVWFGQDVVLGPSTAGPKRHLGKRARARS